MPVLDVDTQSLKTTQAEQCIINTGVIIKQRILTEDGLELAEGRCGDVVSFHIDKPTHIRMTCGGYKCPYQIVEAGKRYSADLSSSVFRTYVRFNPVDVIDSD